MWWGHGYVTERDGNAVVIRDVEIMGELPAGSRGNAVPIDEKWLQAALATATRRAEGGYLPPVHVYHSRDGTPGAYDGTIPAGVFRLTRVQDGKDADGYRGKVLVGDVWLTNPDVIDMYLAGRLPYRSAEIRTPTKQRVDSLALIPAAPPHFKFPLLRPRAGFRLADTGAGMILLAETKDEPKAAIAPMAEMVDGPKEEYEKAKELESDEDKLADAILETHRLLRDLIQRLDTFMPGLQTPYNPRPNGTKLAEAPDFKRLADMVGSQAGELAVLKAKLAEQEKKAEEETVIREALASIAEWPEASVKLAEDGIRAAMKAGGKSAVDACLEVFKASTPKDMKAGDAVRALHAVDSPAVLKFAQRPEDLADARRFSQMYSAVKKMRVIRPDMTEEQFIDAQMKLRAQPAEN